MSEGPFTRLDPPEPFPGTVTRIHTGLRHIEVGDIIAIEWMHEQPAIGRDVVGKISKLNVREGVGQFGPALVADITLEEGWHSMGLDHVLTPEPGSEDDVDGNSVLSFKPNVSRAALEYTWQLTTADQPGWHLYILGGSDERLEEIARLTGKSVEELTRSNA